MLGRKIELVDASGAVCAIATLKSPHNPNPIRKTMKAARKNFLGYNNRILLPSNCLSCQISIKKSSSSPKPKHCANRRVRTKNHNLSHYRSDRWCCAQLPLHCTATIRRLVSYVSATKHFCIVEFVQRRLRFSGVKTIQ